MKHRTAALVLVTGLCLFLALWRFGSSAFTANTTSKRYKTSSESVRKPNADEDADEQDQNDPDLPPGFRGRIDEASYLLARERFIAQLRGWDPDKPFDPEARGKAIRQMEQQEAQRDEKDNLLTRLMGLTGIGLSSQAAWTELGPRPIPNGQTSPSNPVSGRVTAIEIDPNDPNKVYVGAAQGGVYRSLDGGATWTPIFDSAQSLAIGSLTLDAANGRLWVGTGEANGSLDSFAGVGIYRIENVNTTADLFGPINPIRNYVDNSGIARSAPAFNGRSISKILIAPGDSTMLLVGAVGGFIGIGGNIPLGNAIPPLGLRGLYKLTNATGAPGSVNVARIAVTSNPISGTCFDTPCTGNRNVNDMVFDLSDASGNTLVVWLNGTNVAGDGGVYRSTNAFSGSPTFTQTLITTSTSTSNGRGVFVVAQKAPSPALIYVASGEPSTGGTLCNSSTNSGALRRSTDGGLTWSGKLPGGGGFCSSQCFYNIGIDLVPGATTASDKILLGGNVQSANCAKLEGTSLDGAATAFSNTDSGLHPDTHVIKIAPSNSNIVYRGDDGGIWKSANGGNTWSSLNNSTFRATQFQSLSVHPIDRNYTIGGTQDNGTEFFAPDGATWIWSDGGDGGYALIDQNSPDTTNVTAYHTYFNSSGSRVGFARATSTVSPGDPFWNVLFGCPGTANGIGCSDAVNFYAPMALGPGNPNTVYFGSDRLYRSIDKGATMSLVSQGPLVSTVPVSAIGISPQHDGYRIAGLDNGALFYTTTGSATLSALDPVGAGGVIPDFYVARIVFDPANKNTAYISLGNYAGGTSATQSHLWRVTSLSTSPAFTPINGSGGNILPDVPVNGFAVDPLNSNVLYAGTDIGVYNSTDGGANWIPFGTGLPRVAVFDIAIQPPNRVLRIATHGRGMWEIPLITPGPSTAQFATASYPVGEGDVDVIVTVTRVGDTSFPATVNYSTSDTAGTATCDGPSTGHASSRCDYIATVGTLQFAANETVKTISIPIVDDSFAEGSESFSLTLSSPTGSGLSLGPLSSTTITISDNGDANGANPVDVADFFVRQHYIDFLNREPDASGRAFWVNQITSCGADAACTEVRRINVSAAFYLSIEFQDTGYLVYRIYKTAYGNISGAPVPITFGEFLPDTLEISRGVIVNQGNWQQQLEDNKQSFTEEFVQRTRFATAYPANMTAAQFVDKMNMNAGGALSQAERDQMVADLNAGVKTRAQALRAAAEDPDLNAAEFNKAFVLMQYFGYLRRNPYDPPEMTLDYSGYNFWLNKLNQFGGNFVNAEMVKSFIVSGEYRHRFGP
jgi:hypothetical protein